MYDMMKKFGWISAVKCGGGDFPAKEEYRMVE